LSSSWHPYSANSMSSLNTSSGLACGGAELLVRNEMGVRKLDVIKSDASSIIVRGLRWGMDVRRYVLLRHASEEVPDDGKDGSQANCADISPVSDE
jgi:hypothetical protein